jgi:superfamily I DNA/RNA helicase
LNINVESYDEFINQLVRTRPKKGYEHLAGYATDARYTGFRIIYSSNDEYAALLQDAQETVAVQYPDRVKEYYLDSSDAEGFEWVKDELQWIEARFEDEQAAIEDYPKARRVGRGTRHQPNERIRKIILEIWTEFNRLLAKNRRYTIDQATKRLLCSNSLPSYDAIAIDEVQDFSLLSIKLLLRFRRSDTAKVFLSGDENQKIYQRDFTWKELDEGLKGRTITLRKNMRNTSAIRHFSGRLIGAECPHDAAKDMVHIVDADDARTMELLRKLTDPRLNQTAALITGRQRNWEELLRSEGIPFSRKPAGDILSPGLYILGNLKGKGLEFDNVVVDYMQEFSEDEEEEKRLRYVHFTRARKRLYIRYQHTPPKLISKYYADFLV